MNQTSYSPDKFGTYLSHPGSQGCDIFYANFIQWAHEGGNCYSTIKLYCNLLKAALVWASRHGCILSQTYNAYEVPRLTYKLLKKYNYRCPYTSNVSNYNRYLHDLLKLVGEEFNESSGLVEENFVSVIIVVYTAY